MVYDLIVERDNYRNSNFSLFNQGKNRRDGEKKNESWQMLQILYLTPNAVLNKKDHN